MSIRSVLLSAGLIVAGFTAYSQCTTTNATSCSCEDTSSTNCDLLPDITIGKPPLLVSGSLGIIEYAQKGNGSNNGRLRVSVSTPNIGFGPLEVRTTNQYVCGTDTITGTAPATCPNTGLPPTQLLQQRIYHKNGNTMSYYDRNAGSMTYHPGHGHMHVDDWGIYTLRKATPDPDPLNWPVVGTGAKLAFCLMDYGSCSTYPGHCVDSSGNTLLNGDFPNYGLGGASYNCSAIVQGISSGFTDIYYQYLDGMYIDIPPGTCNGDYYIVVELDPYNYFLESREDNNMIAVPFTLTQQEIVPDADIISTSGNSVFCDGSGLTLEASYGPTYNYLWSTGETTQSINVSSDGSYMVTVTSACSTNVSLPFQVSSVGAPPTTTGDSICGSGSLTLSASGTGQIKWFDAPSGGNQVGSGATFTTPALNSTTNYYAEVTDSVPDFTDYTGMPDNTNGAGGFYKGNQFMLFDVYSDIELKSVKIYAQDSGDVTIELRNSGNTVIDSITVFVPSGENRINLNWSILPGTDYTITRLDTTALYRSSSGMDYPYTIPGHLSITNSSAGIDFYYFFYDWEVDVPGYECVSSRVAATATISGPAASISASGPTTFCGGGNVVLNATTGPGYSYQWKKYGKIVSGATSDFISAEGNGKYKCVVTDVNGCSKVSNLIQVNVLPLPNSSISAAGPTSFCWGGEVTLHVNTIPGGTYQWKKYGNPVSGATADTLVSSGNGKFKCVVTDSMGCARASNAISVSILPLPPAVISSSGPTDICMGDSVELAANSGAGYTYQWKRYNSFISGATGNSYHAKKEGKYKVVITDSNGCARGSNSLFVNIVCREAGEPRDGFTIFPNPADGYIDLTLSSEVAGVKTINIYDIKGAIVHSATTDNDITNVVRLDIRHLDPGLYQVVMRTDHSIRKAPLMVQ